MAKKPTILDVFKRKVNTALNTKFVPGQKKTIAEVAQDVRKDPGKYILSSAFTREKGTIAPIARPVGQAANELIRTSSLGFVRPPGAAPKTPTEKAGAGVGFVAGMVNPYSVAGKVLGPIGAVGEKGVGKLIGSRLAPQAIKNAPNLIKTIAKGIGGEVAQSAAYVGAKRATGQKQGFTEDLLAGIGFRGAFGTLGKALKDVSPNAFKIDPNDEVLLKGYTYRILNPKLPNVKRLDKEELKDLQNLAEHYLGEKFRNASTKKIAEGFEYFLARKGGGDAAFPKMGLVSNDPALQQLENRIRSVGWGNLTDLEKKTAQQSFKLEDLRDMMNQRPQGYFRTVDQQAMQTGQKPAYMQSLIDTQQPTQQIPQQAVNKVSSMGNVPPSSQDGSIADPVQKIITALKEAKPIRREQEALYTKERGKRIARAIEVGKKTSGEQGFFAQLGQMKGQLPKAEYESLRGKVTQQDVDTLFNKMKESTNISEWEKFTAGSGLMKILGQEGGQVPTAGEIKTLNRVFGKEFTDAVLSKRSNMQKLLSGTAEVLNLPRALMSTLDFSAPLRQGIVFSGKKQWWGAFATMFKQFGSQKAWEAVQQDIRNKPTYDMMVQNKLALTSMDAPLEGREEAFMSNLAERIPLIGRAVKASDRAYTGFLNKLRADVFDDLVKKAEKTGAIDDPTFLPSLASFINTATGRGGLGPLERAATTLNSVFFSPRLMASRVNMMNPIYYTKLNPQVRKEAIKSMLTFGATAGTVLGLAKLSGAEVGTDPRSADFGKIKAGNTRYDIFGGFQQYIKLGAQLSTGSIISSTTGKEIRVGEGYKPMTRKDILERFFESKTAPVASLILDTLRGETSIGEKLDPKSMIAQRFIPMVTQDFYDAYQEWGLEGIGRATPALFGVGSQTYGGTPVNLQEAEQRGDVDLYRYLKTLDKKEANAYIQKLPEDDTSIRKFEKFKALDDIGLGEPEYRMVGSGIKNGDRAEMIVRELNKRKTKEEKNKYIDALYEADLMTDDIYDQLVQLRQKGGLKSAQ